MVRFFPVVLAFACCMSCTENGAREPVEYTGPLREVENIERYGSENLRVTSKLTAPLFYEFGNGDLEFPKGILIERYNEFGRLQSTLRANYAKFIKEKDHWLGQGKVELKNVETDEQLNTEELYWSQKTKKIFTDKFVTIHQQGDILYGTGLTAMQDLSDYEILKPEGTIEVKEE